MMQYSLPSIYNGKISLYMVFKDIPQTRFAHNHFGTVDVSCTDISRTHII